jgi:hypothetical protein
MNLLHAAILLEDVFQITVASLRFESPSTARIRKNSSRRAGENTRTESADLKDRAKESTKFIHCRSSWQ